MTIRRCQRDRAFGRGLRTMARLFGLRASRDRGSFDGSSPPLATSSDNGCLRFEGAIPCCSSAKRLLSASPPIFIAAALATSCCSFSFALALTAAASAARAGVRRRWAGLGSGLLPGKRGPGVAVLVDEANWVVVARPSLRNLGTSCREYEV